MWLKLKWRSCTIWRKRAGFRSGALWKKHKMINRELELTFAAAIKEAKQRRHEFFTLEHILYAIVHDVTGRRI
ncbi:MAG: Clp protease N-terminal domain-containing protein, partial [Syntrophobacteraceae bacterium]